MIRNVTRRNFAACRRLALKDLGRSRACDGKGAGLDRGDGGARVAQDDRNSCGPRHLTPAEAGFWVCGASFDPGLKPGWLKAVSRSLKAPAPSARADRSVESKSGMLVPGEFRTPFDCGSLRSLR
jgi:hypothetical protein